MLLNVWEMANLNSYLTIKEAAELVGVCPMTLRRWGLSGKIKSYRNPVNNYRLYRKTDLQKFLIRLAKSKQ
jgi:DNA (cytosine-5)-methyltransferase 1